MTAADERELLIEQVVAAWRPEHQDGGVRAHPAWHDLDEAGREEAARRAMRARVMEAALDPEGLSTTARLVFGEDPGVGRGRPVWKAVC